MRLTIVKPHGLVILAFVVGLAILSISSMSSAGVITYATSNFTSFVLNESHITNRPAFLSLASSTDQNPVGEIKPLITSGENLSNGNSFTGIPDGLGAVGIKNGNVDIFVNHEHDIEENGENAMDLSEFPSLFFWLPAGERSRLEP